MITKPLAVTLLLAFTGELLFPLTAYAIGGGPSQPEATGFRPAGAADMVDPYSGDFNYNIPLLDVDGYPVNLAYSSGISMEQEASWVGLGWILNVGALNRSMRGIPDDFNGDNIKKELNIKSNHTYGTGVDVDLEMVGISFGKLGIKGGSQQRMGINWNNYNGIGTEFSFNSVISGGKGGFGLTASLGLNASSSGASVSGGVNASYSCSSMKRQDENSTSNTNYGLSLGLPYNSSTGLGAMTYGVDIQRTTEKTVMNAQTGEMELKPKTTSFNVGSSIGFGYPFRIPHTRLNMFNTNLSFKGTLGMEAFGLHGNATINAYYAGQFLVDKTKEIASYGYLNTQSGQDKDGAMLDFNREKDGTYTEHTPRLPVTNYTYDVLNASGQGMSGCYRPYRNDVGVMRDDQVRSYSAGMDMPGMEFGAANGFHIGVDFHLNATDAYSGRWKDDNDIYEKLKSSGNQAGAYEPYYYKKVGEKTPDDNADFLALIGDNRPVRVNLKDRTQSVLNQLENDNGITTSLSGTLKKNVTARARRNEPLFGLKAGEAGMTLDKNIRIYDFITTEEDQPISKELFEPDAYTELSREDRPAHHMSEYTAVNTSGARYVYGIPAYNNLHQEVTFAVPAPDAGAEGCSYADLIDYTATDDSKSNGNGLDNYYERVTTPAYAHSYLLTSVLSDDYADLTGNGPSDDDKGTYTKFNYSRIESFNWRSPYTATNTTKSAFYNPGIGVDKLDDKASYSYGEKELWYLHSIETKNYVAIFVTEDRADGCSAAGNSGGRGTVKSKLLKRIELYVKSELLGATSMVKAIPVKVVHFEYDYTLCKGVPSNGNTDPVQSGKLTLTGVHFTYGNSARAASRGYTFAYLKTGAGDYQNPDYTNKAYDRWGTYKPASELVSNADYPYAEQSKSLADQYAAAWNLRQINLPSGGTISVDYEADDYGFVQDKRAMQMFTVIGSSLTRNENPFSETFEEKEMDCSSLKRNEGTLYEESTTLNGGLECSPYQYFYLKVNDPVGSKEELKDKYFTDENGAGIKEMYYKFFVKTKDEDNVKPSAYEAVPGYISESELDYGLCDYGKIDDKTQYIWIRLQPVNIGDYVQTGNANPISRSAWNLLRLRYPRLGQARADYDPGQSNPLAIVQELASSVYQVIQLVQGYNFSMRQRNLCRLFDRDKSVFRLYSPTHKKIGGGSRVKRVMLNDQFNQLTGSDAYGNEFYGKEYTYTTSYRGKQISSGVATYEPMMGGEESPFRSALIKGKDRKFMAIGVDYLQEGKFGESFFPFATVGYRKVTVKSIKRSNARSTATGKEEHEFYTNYDFPDYVNETANETYRDKPNLLSSIFKFYSKDHMATSQGYAIELNDMAGKPKSVKSYPEYIDSMPVNSTEYFYKRNAGDPSKLVNTITTIDRTGAIHRNVTVGVETDIVADMREEKTRTHGGALAANLDAFIAFLPIALPFLVPTYSQENVYFRSAVITKVFNRSGLLDSVVVKDMGARKTTCNLAVDAESGEVLVTRINNNFNDSTYQVNLPAYWMYPEMAHAYKKTGAVYTFDEVLANPSAYLSPGDEVSFGNYYGWVTNVAPSLGILSNLGVYYNLAEIIDEEEVTYLKVVRSGSHNKIMLPASSTLVKDDPLAGNQLTLTNVIDANAQVYDDNWKIFCGCTNVTGQGYNPYVAGRKGNYRLLKEYVFLSNRTQTKYNRNLNVRKDGVYTSFTPFWNYSTVWTPEPAMWTYANENTIFSATGAQNETRDALNRFSSAQFAFNDRANVAVGQNAMYREIGFEAFEDYDFLFTEACKQAHFSFYGSYLSGVNGGLVGTKSDISLSGDSHSGKYALKIHSLNNYIKIRKTISPCK